MDRSLEDRWGSIMKLTDQQSAMKDRSSTVERQSRLLSKGHFKKHLALYQEKNNHTATPLNFKKERSSSKHNE